MMLKMLKCSMMLSVRSLLILFHLIINELTIFYYKNCAETISITIKKENKNIDDNVSDSSDSNSYNDLMYENRIIRNCLLISFN